MTKKELRAMWLEALDDHDDYLAWLCERAMDGDLGAWSDAEELCRARRRQRPSAVGPRMQTVTVDDVLSWGPCDDYHADTVHALAAGLPEEATAAQIHDHLRGEIPTTDLLWLLCHDELVDPRILRECACDWVERAMRLLPWLDVRSWAATATARRYARGDVSWLELSRARAAGWAAAEAADEPSGLAFAAARVAVRPGGIGAAAYDAALASARAAGAAWDAAEAGMLDDLRRRLGGATAADPKQLQLL